MAKPSEKLAESLKVLHVLQESGGVAIRSVELTRTHRERLCRNGFLQEVIKGWYIPTRPDENSGESTAWYASFWRFCAAYLQHRFGKQWCLSAEQSLSLHSENWTVPPQLLIRSPKAQNNISILPHNTSLLDVRASLPEEKAIVEQDGLRYFSLPEALIACSPHYFRQNPTEVRAALSKVVDASQLLDRLLEGGHSSRSGRLAGAFRNMRRDRIADDIVRTMQTAGYEIRENDPFETPTPLILTTQQHSPYVNRIRLMWQEMREPIIERFPEVPGLPKEREHYLQRIEERYLTDAYHSLSIEGYRVSPELIQQVRSGNWNPAEHANDLDQHNALAARGYWQAYQTVQESINKVLHGDNPSAVVNDDHRIWYREMFAPSVTAGILRPTDLAGYRSERVYIRRSMHIPASCEAIREAMPALFELLNEEPQASVRALLGHFIFVYIHPYMDGNGRMGRFLMNVMLASGGYPWIVVPLEQRRKYMAALEEASVNRNIVPFSHFMAQLITPNETNWG